ncbi:hypothetical protein CONLIGDRAFT_649917 [Coniochaeta ligniaria NRRL 30616]|uniref:Uncharacterized protein n=1 Tax=Coniochaeta ligniaria NRRL 30616 TaxID=1408157 RepID=A0A1J7I6L7_9PEZI|nr:hypothetical protein CONLIGDRAFT_649917 [Coniochaeta ligniaria NRRL 30616]
MAERHFCRAPRRSVTLVELRGGASLWSSSVVERHFGRAPWWSVTLIPSGMRPLRPKIQSGVSHDPSVATRKLRSLGWATAQRQLDPPALQLQGTSESGQEQSPGKVAKPEGASRRFNAAPSLAPTRLSMLRTTWRTDQGALRKRDRARDARSDMRLGPRMAHSNRDATIPIQHLLASDNKHTCGFTMLRTKC